jgi:hypothetical protein
MSRTPLLFEEHQRRAAELAAAISAHTENVESKSTDPISVLDKDERQLQGRVQKNYLTLTGDGGFSSWERVLCACAVLTYRRLRKPALGPVGDWLDDMELRS